MSHPRPLAAFGGYGIEIEYMLVDRETFDVKPVADRLLAAAAGRLTNEYADGPIAWSNELSLHVIELKTNGPAPTLAGLADAFGAALARIEQLLLPLGARVLPGAMHPWMDPATEQRLWPHEQNEIYAAYDRIFGCHGHGWANLQSMHINLPFADDDEFRRLHTAIRTLLPLLPALAAGSPFVDGRISGFQDSRLELYRVNQRRVPEITGLVVPDYVGSMDEYQARILQPMYAAIAPLDPAGVLRGEWLNSRGAIARFDRHAIEIRVLDAQECPAADLAIAQAVCAIVRELYEERHAPAARQAALATAPLADLFVRAVRDGERVLVTDADYLAALGLPATVRDGQAVWRALLARAAPALAVPCADALATLLAQGPLARRLLAAAGVAPDRRRLATICAGLCESAFAQRAFTAE